VTDDDHDHDEDDDDESEMLRQISRVYSSHQNRE
jgi:hypothetical protein